MTQILQIIADYLKQDFFNLIDHNDLRHQRSNLFSIFFMEINPSSHPNGNFLKIHSYEAAPYSCPILKYS